MSECCGVVAPPAGHPIISVSNGLSYEPLLDRLVKPIKMHVAKLSDGGHPVCQHFCRLISLRKDSTQLAWNQDYQESWAEQSSEHRDSLVRIWLAHIDLISKCHSKIHIWAQDWYFLACSNFCRLKEKFDNVLKLSCWEAKQNKESFIEYLEGLKWQQPLL